MYDRRLGVAVVGLGCWGARLARVFARLQRARVVALCDQRQDRLAALPELGRSALRTTHLEPVLQLAETEAVVVATCPASHAALAEQALAAGKHVFIEKPMALRSTDALRVSRQAERAGRKLMVGHILEYHPAFERLRSLIDAGTLGPLLHVACQRMGRSTRRHETAWWSLAPHDLGLLRVLAGADPVHLQLRPGSGGSSDAVVASLQFRSGLCASVEVSTVHHQKIRRLIAVGARRTAVFDDQQPCDKLRIFEPAPARLGHTVRQDSRAELRLPGPPTFSGLGGQVIEVEQTEPLEREARHFVEALLDGQPIRTDAALGVAVVRLLELGQRSLRRGEQERIGPADQPDKPSTSAA